jgi:muramoyltetrapeptide carboxypeptidase
VRIRIEGPSSPFRPEALDKGVQTLRAWGHDVSHDDSALRGRHAYLNGDDDVRRRDLEAALGSDVDVLWLARGGYGLTRIVDDLVIPSRVPVVVGFSDATALFARLAVAGHLDRCIHGPLATTLAAEADDSIARVITVAARRARATTTTTSNITTPAVLPPLRVSPLEIMPRTVSGPLWAGNLVVLAALCGTPSMPNLRGHIVVIEDVGERPYRLDRVLTQLRRAGAFDGVVAVVVGHLTGCNEPVAAGATSTNAVSTRDPVPTGLDVVIERLGGLGVPLVAGLPSGHEAPNLALPLGGLARLDVDGAVATLVADG